ncbi:MAG: hypothetical protein HRU77_01465 [Gammaproteobacteria bacterium]|nr:MAG: hypothetical protein HRU77_01465 [Gammaproteobacteria bacterium]
MAGFKLNVFSGIRPRAPESLLQENEATDAKNCDFAYGELRNTKGGFEYLTLSNSPKGIYTDNGLTFYSWLNDADAVRSPLVNDPFDRVYFTQDNLIRVASRTGTRVNGGPPSTSYRVGVPRPSVAPSLVTSVNVPDASKANIVFTFHWESVGVKYQEQTINPTILSDSTAQFTPPARDESTPSTAFPVLRMTASWKSDDTLIFDIYTTNSSFDSSTNLYTLDITKDPGDGVTTYTAKITLTINEADKEARAYVYTYVNIYNEEGPPSSYAITTLLPTFEVDVTVVKDSISDYAPIKEIRIYRTPSGADVTDFYYVGSLYVLSDSGSLVFRDNVAGAMLNELLSSTNYYAPQPVSGLSILPNGILMAFDQKNIYLSEPYKPWAWPPGYAKPLPYEIMGLIVAGSGAIATTKSQPYLVSGVSPDAMTVSKINIDQAGVSKWSMAVADGLIVYASHDGIVSINGVTGSLVESQNFFTREVWRQRYGSGLSSMHFAVWDGRLVVYSHDNAFTPFMIRFDEAGGTMTDLPDFVAKCSFVNPVSDQFYYANGNKLYQFAGGSSQNATWQSAEKVLLQPLNFGAAQAVVEGNWTIEFWAYVKNYATGFFEYQLKHSQAVATGQTDFRLPSGYESDRYRIRITGNGRFRELRVAQTFKELVAL